jgi:hypothetical protein
VQIRAPLSLAMVLGSNMCAFAPTAELRQATALGAAGRPRISLEPEQYFSIRLSAATTKARKPS